MEHTVVAPAAGTVAEVLVQPGQQLDGGQPLVQDRVAVKGTRARSASPTAAGSSATASPRHGEMVDPAVLDDSPIDVLTGDWLAELTMLILHKQRARDSEPGYAATFLTQMEQVLGTCIERGIKVVTNAGGLNPAGCARQVRDLGTRLGLNVDVAHVEGDDLLARIDGLRPQLDQPRHRRAVHRHGRERQRLPRRVGHRRAPSPPAPTSSSARESPTPPWSSDRQRGGGTGPSTTGTRWPARSSPGTSSSAARRPPAATTAGSARSPTRPGRSASRSPRSTATATRVDHQAPGHRRDRRRRHGHRPAALRDRPTRVPQPRRHHPLRARSSSARTARTGCCVSGTCGSPAPRQGQGQHQLRRRLPQPDDVRAHRARPAGQGRLGARRSCSSASVARIASTRSTSASSPPRRRDRPGGRVGPPARQRQEQPTSDSSVATSRPRPPSWRWPAIPASSPPSPPGPAQAYGMFWPALVSHRRPPPRRRPRRWPPATIVPFPPTRPRCATIESRDPVEVEHRSVPHPASRSARCFAARSGDKGGNANVGIYARDDAGYAWLREQPHHRGARAADPRGRRTGDPSLRAAQPAGPQLRHRRLPGRRRRRQHRVRSAGQGPRRVPPQPGPPVRPLIRH